ncbi:hypothetical protein LOAG_08035 [Loa loa]|uniref:DNA polymerase epsilon subunit B N-terminal domain-containing protein n=1 Tax=Loa loa TaxID=7209 RepID=A0A1S0TUD9_LOALO|nr:hypothetical protein LOAG_08035 [Loa loa]EFO20452.2 hypothetical protein LOAG_08035 [Loa loa]
MPTDSDVEKLRKQVRKAFQMRALTVSKEAMEYAVEILIKLEGEERIRWINKVISMLSKQKASGPVLSFNEFRSAVTECVSNHSSKQESLIHVIDLFTVPRLRYDEQRKVLVVVDGQASVVGQSADARNLYRERLKLVVQVSENFVGENSLAIVQLLSFMSLRSLSISSGLYSGPFQM